MSTVQNILAYSEDISQTTVWGRNLISTVTGGQSDPFGGTTAYALIESVDASISAHYMAGNPALPNGGYITFSIYAKAAARSWLWMYPIAGNIGIGKFDLTNGLATTTDVRLNVQITAVGNGWYKCEYSSAFPIADGNQQFVIVIASSSVSNSYQGNGSTALYLCRGQETQSNWSGPYVYTSGKIINNGPIRNRIPVGQNYFPYSDAFEVATKTNVGSTVAGYPDPFGENTARLFTDTIDGGVVYHNYTQTCGGLCNGTSAKVSVYAKAGTKSFIRITQNTSGNGASFNLSTGATGLVTSGITATATRKNDGWWRCSISGVVGPAGSPFTLGGNSFVVTIANDSTTAGSYQGDGTGTLYLCRLVGVNQVNWEGPPLSTNGNAYVNGQIRNIVT